MNLKDFTMLCYAAKYKLYDLAIMKFRAELYLNKYLMVSAPGEAAPSVKQSYIRLKVTFIRLRQNPLKRMKKTMHLLE